MTIHVDANELAARMDELGRLARQGEDVVVLLNGEPIWTLHPVPPKLTEAERAEAMRAFERIRRNRKDGPSVTTEEILAWRDEGRKY